MAADTGAVPAHLLTVPLTATATLAHPRATVRRIAGRWWVTLWADRDEVADTTHKHVAWLHHTDALDWAAQRVHHERLAAGQTLTTYWKPTP